jgi:hypothetical protein
MKTYIYIYIYICILEPPSYISVLLDIGTSNFQFSLLLVAWDYVPYTAATSGLFYQPQMIGQGNCGETDGMKMAGETEVLGETLP